MKKKSKDDFNLEIDDLVSTSSNTSSKEEENGYYKEILIKEEKEKDSNSYEAVVRRLEKATHNKTWISVPVYNSKGHYIGEYGRELSECTGEEFFKWINHVYPAAKAYNHSPENYKDKTSRESAFIEIVTFLSNFKTKFSINLAKPALS